MSCRELKVKYKEQKNIIKNFLVKIFYQKYFSQFGKCLGGSLEINFDEHYSIYIMADNEIEIRFKFNYYKEENTAYGSDSCLTISSKDFLFEYDWYIPEIYKKGVFDKYLVIIKYFEKHIDIEFENICQFVVTYYDKLYNTNFYNDLIYSLLVLKSLFPKDIYFLISKKLFFFSLFLIFLFLIFFFSFSFSHFLFLILFSHFSFSFFFLILHFTDYKKINKSN